MFFVFFFFFFFKQKTAYEMSIGDWSSDVCSSDLRRTRAGGTAVNDTLLHFYQLNLPFGGVGNSGVGKGHGVFGFEAFSNARGVFEQPTRFSMIQLLYPPYTGFKQKLIDLTVKYF